MGCANDHRPLTGVLVSRNHYDATRVVQTERLSSSSFYFPILKVVTGTGRKTTMPLCEVSRGHRRPPFSMSCKRVSCEMPKGATGTQFIRRSTSVWVTLRQLERDLGQPTCAIDSGNDSGVSGFVRCLLFPTCSIDDVPTRESGHR